MRRQINHRNLQTKLGFTPHLKQQFILDNLKRFNIFACGRRFGKSYLVAYIAFARLIQTNRRIWIVAPTYSLTDKVWRIVYGWSIRYGSDWIISIDRQKLSITTIWGTVLECKSADNPVSLIGEGVTDLIIDEMARVKQIVYEEALRPTLTDKKGNLYGISSPKGRDYFHSLYVRGQDPLEKDYFSIQLPTADNPYIDPAEIEEARRTLPENVFKQEYLAEFIEDAGSVFRSIRKCATGKFEDPIDGVMYVFAVDLAKHEDFTVILVARADTRSVVYHERFNQISWPLQKQRIISVVNNYNRCIGIIDSSGIGDTIYDDLVRAGVSVTPFKFTGTTKPILVENLTRALDQEELTYPPIPELLNELEIYEYTITPSRTFKYSAPAGMHDDEVMALGLLNEKLIGPKFNFVM